MKTLFALVLLACAYLPMAHAGVPAPKPTFITVGNLKAFPQYRFSYRLVDEQKIRPITDGKAFSTHHDIDLLVKSASGSEAEQPWERIRYEWRGANISLQIQAVSQEGKTIRVKYVSTGKDPVPGKKSAAAAETPGGGWPFFGLTAMGAVGLVVLARRRSSGN